MPTARDRFAHERKRVSEALDGFYEGPGGDGAHLNLARCYDRVATHDAPAVVEGPDHGHLLTKGEHELVRQHGREELADFAAFDAEEGRSVAVRGHARRGATLREAENGASPRRAFSRGPSRVE